MVGNAQTKAIGTSLATYFVDKGLTQVQVAEMYRISQSWVGRIYHGEFSKRATTVRNMCEAAGIPFLNDNEKQQGDGATKYRLLRLLDSVWEGTEEDATHLIAALRAIKQLRTSTSRVCKWQNIDSGYSSEPE